MGEACLNYNIYAEAFLADANLAPTENRQSSWYVLKIRTGGEQAAVAALRHRGFAPYCPTQKERRRYSDRMKVVDAAVFPGYVFCQFDLQKKTAIISSPGVEYIVGFGDGAIAVPEEELLNIQRLIDAGATAVRSLPRGQRVRVIRGPLEGVEGILICDSTGERLVVSVKLLSQGASLLINQYEVCPIGNDE